MFLSKVISAGSVVGAETAKGEANCAGAGEAGAEGSGEKPET